jgi:hypothetical protein
MSDHLSSRCAVALATLLLGCAKPATETGSVTVAIVATGAHGATYRLPAGTTLQLENQSFGSAVALDGPGASISVEVPPGDYTPSLRHPIGYTTTWPLERERADGTTEIVAGRLVLPVSVTVEANLATDLVVKFVVTSGEIVEFSHGSIDATVDVEETTAASYDLTGDAALVTTSATVRTNAAPPDIIARLPQTGTAGYGVNYTINFTGPFSQRGFSIACGVRQSLVILGAGHPGFVDLMTESLGAVQVEVCVSAIDATHVETTIGIERGGAATTTSFSDLGDRQCEFDTLLDAVVEIREPVFDGQTLDLEALRGSRPASIVIFTKVSGTPVGQTAPLESWYEAFHEGSGTLTFTPL